MYAARVILVLSYSCKIYLCAKYRRNKKDFWNRGHLLSNDNRKERERKHLQTWRIIQSYIPNDLVVNSSFLIFCIILFLFYVTQTFDEFWECSARRKCTRIHPQSNKICLPTFMIDHVCSVTNTQVNLQK